MVPRSVRVPGSLFPLFGPRLASARARAGLTTSACARRCRISKDQWLLWEAGREMPYTGRELASIAALVGADPDWLLGLRAPFRSWPVQSARA